MRYSIDINRSVEDLAYCLQRISNEINNIYDWRISINAGGIDYGIYFNFDIDNKELEICNQPRYDDTLYLDEIIDKINEYDED
jgi:hypothetical protein